MSVELFFNRQHTCVGPGSSLFDYAETLGIAVPKTVLLPHKKFPPQINERSLRNLQFPLDWDGIFELRAASAAR